MSKITMRKIIMMPSIVLLAGQIAEMITLKVISSQRYLPRRLMISKQGQDFLMSPLIKWILAGLMMGVIVYIAWRALSPERGGETAQQLADALKGQQEPLT